MFLERNIHIHVLAMIELFIASRAKTLMRPLAAPLFSRGPFSLLKVEIRK